MHDAVFQQWFVLHKLICRLSYVLFEQICPGNMHMLTVFEFPAHHFHYLSGNLVCIQTVLGLSKMLSTFCSQTLQIGYWSLNLDPGWFVLNRYSICHACAHMYTVCSTFQLLRTNNQRHLIMSYTLALH